MALTEAQKRANRNEELRRKALGDVKVTVWLSAAAKIRLDELTAKFGTRQRALESAMMTKALAYSPDEVSATHVAPTPANPASEPEKPPSVALKSRPAFNPQPKKGKKK